MKSKNYWINRANERMVDYIGGAEKAANEIASAYYSASDFISGEIDKIFNKYRVDGGLTEEDARRLLNNIEGNVTRQKLLDSLSALSRDTQRVALNIINAPAYAARIKRLEDLQREIDSRIISIAQFEFTKSTDFYIDAISEGYNRALFDIQKGTGLGFSTSGISEKKVSEILKEKWSGVNYSKRIWNNTDQLAERVKNDLLSGFLSGKSNAKMAAEIQNDFAVGSMEAQRLVRTETNYMANRAELQSYKGCGIEQYEYLATLDIRTSDICQSLDGKRFDIDKAQPGVNCPPMHPYCRSTTIAVIGDEEIAGMERKARDPATGKAYKVPANMSYPKWKERYITGDPKASAALAKYKNQYSDKAQYSRYIATLGANNVPKSFVKFQDLKYNNISGYSAIKTQYTSKLQKSWETDVLKRNSSLEGFAAFETERDIPGWLENQINSWNEEERSALNYYTSHNYSKINDFLRGKASAGRGIEEKITLINSAIEKANIEDSVVVWRGTSFSNLVQGDILKATPIQEWRDMYINDNAFSSTSLIQRAAFSKEIEMQILLSKGKRGAYIDELSEFPGEYEVLLQNGAALKILSAESRSGKYFIKAILME